MAQPQADDVIYRLHTCSYTEMRAEMGAGIRTSLGAPRWKLKYDIADVIKEITPNRDFLQAPKHEFRRLYIAKLRLTGTEKLARRFAAAAEALGTPDLVLLCFDKLYEEGNWCHRTIFAQWWHDETGETVTELGRVWAPPPPASPITDPMF